MVYADYILKSEAVFSCLEDKPFKGWVAVKGNKILAVGKEHDDIGNLVGDNTETLDFNKKMIMPGFIDAHVHYFDGAVMASEHMCSVHLSTSEEDALGMLSEYRKTHPDEKRIRAIGWLPATWNDAELPTRKSLDSVFPDIPVYCISADIHTFWVNSEALKECGINKCYMPTGGSVGKYDNGELNGLLFEPGAFGPAMDKVMEFDKEATKNNLQAFMKLIAQAGVTTVSDMCAYDYKESTRNKLESVKEMSLGGEMTSRLHVYTKLDGYTDFTAALAYKREFWNDVFRVVGVKSWIDGVTSTFTAYMLEPYEDNPKTCGEGVPIIPKEDMQVYVNAANKAGLPVRLHCIGDAAIRMSLDMFENSIKVNGRHGLKNTIEHIETIHLSDIPRFKELDVIPSMQPQHLILDYNEKVRRLGKERASWEWAHKSLLKSGAQLAFGTDYPVVDFNPYPSLYAAVARKDEDGNPAGINPEECITLAEAIYAYTAGSARVYDREDIGVLQPGNLADIIVVDRNLFDVCDEEIKYAKTDFTMMGGKIVYKK